MVVKLYMQIWSGFLRRPKPLQRPLSVHGFGFFPGGLSSEGRAGLWELLVSLTLVVLEECRGCQKVMVSYFTRPRMPIWGWICGHWENILRRPLFPHEESDLPVVEFLAVGFESLKIRNCFLGKPWGTENLRLSTGTELWLWCQPLGASHQPDISHSTHVCTSI